MKTLNFEKDLKFAFANDFADKKNYTYFKCIEKENSVLNSTFNTNNNKYTIILDNLRKKKNYDRTSNIVWVCKHCGYIHIGVDAPDNCPICKHPETCFILQASNY